MTSPSQARSGKEKLTTPLRAEPDKYWQNIASVPTWLLRDGLGGIMARGLTERDAALLIAMSEDAKRLREAIEYTLECCQSDAWRTPVYPKNIAMPLAHQDRLKAALAAGDLTTTTKAPL